MRYAHPEDLTLGMELFIYGGVDIFQIAICDDQLNELEIINAYVTEYIATHALEADIRKFSHSDELLTTIGAESFHIYILDIVMPMVSGIELGKEIRRFDREAQIIYTTSDPQFALQAYAASPINYLIKPIDKKQLFDTLNFAISKIDLSEKKTFTVKTADSLRLLNLSDILCCEYHRHAVIFTLINGEEVISRTIRDSFVEYIMPILGDDRFLQCHSSYLINMRRVESFAKDSFTFRGGKVVPIAAKKYPSVRDKYMDFLMRMRVN